MNDSTMIVIIVIIFIISIIVLLSFRNDKDDKDDKFYKITLVNKSSTDSSYYLRSMCTNSEISDSLEELGLTTLNLCGEHTIRFTSQENTVFFNSFNTVSDEAIITLYDNAHSVKYSNIQGILSLFQINSITITNPTYYNVYRGQQISETNPLNFTVDVIDNNDNNKTVFHKSFKLTSPTHNPIPTPSPTITAIPNETETYPNHFNITVKAITKEDNLNVVLIDNKFNITIIIYGDQTYLHNIYINTTIRNSSNNISDSDDKNGDIIINYSKFSKIGYFGGTPNTEGYYIFGDKPSITIT